MTNYDGSPGSINSLSRRRLFCQKISQYYSIDYIVTGQISGLPILFSILDVSVPQIKVKQFYKHPVANGKVLA